MTFIPENYKPVLTVMETEAAIADTKRIFEKYLSAALNLRRISAPMFVRPESGLNDNLNGVERPVSFVILLQSGSAMRLRNTALPPTAVFTAT